MVVLSSIVQHCSGGRKWISAFRVELMSQLVTAFTLETVVSGNFVSNAHIFLPLR